LRDKKFYTRDEFYPSDVFEVTGPFEIDGYNALLVHVRPFQYNPAKRKLIDFGNIAVTINRLVAKLPFVSYDTWFITYYRTIYRRCK
jgi:hypothetical protein